MEMKMVGLWFGPLARTKLDEPLATPSAFFSWRVEIDYGGPLRPLTIPSRFLHQPISTFLCWLLASQWV